MSFQDLAAKIFRTGAGEQRPAIIEVEQAIDEPVVAAPITESVDSGREIALHTRSALSEEPIVAGDILLKNPASVSVAEARAGSMETQYDIDQKQADGSPVWESNSSGTSGGIRTHPINRHRNTETGEEILVKGGPDHTLRGEIATHRLMSLVGVNVPQMSLMQTDQRQSSSFRKDNGLRIASEFRGEFSFGMEFPSKFDRSPEIQQAMLVGIVTMDYDRVPWNMGFDTKNGECLQIDFGGSMGSRAQGGYNGLPLEVDMEQIAVAISNPQFGGPANPAYDNLVDWKAAQEGRLEIKDPRLMAGMIKQLRAISDEQIEAIVDEAYGDIDPAESRVDLQNRIRSLESRSDYKSALARETFQEILDNWGGDQAAYYAEALKLRRDQVADIFEAALAN